MRPSDEAKAIAWRRTVRAEEKDDVAKRIARAVADVMECDVTLDDAMRNRKVPREPLRAALLAAGWQSRVRQPTPRRRTFGNGRRHGT